MTTIEITLLISVVSVFAAIIFSGRKDKRDQNAEIIEKAKQDAKIETKLDDIGSDVKDIKYDMTAMKKDMTALSDRVLVVEQSSKSAHKRLDHFEEILEPSKNKSERTE